MKDGMKYVSSVQNGGVSRTGPSQPGLIAQTIPDAASMCSDAGASQLVSPMNNALAFVTLNWRRCTSGAAAGEGRPAMRHGCDLGMAVLLAAAVSLASCAGDPPAAPDPPPITTPAFPAPSPPEPPPVVFQDEVFVGAGDVADCGLSGSELTARLLDRTPGTVFMIGDGAYGDGKIDEYLECYDPTWGRHLTRTRPVPGNHDYSPASGSGFFAYFAGQIGDGGRSYYDFRLGAWTIYAIDSNIDVDRGSAQYRWLAETLSRTSVECSLAYWHHPLLSSSKGGDNDHMLPIWRLLAEHGADVVLNAHAHIYERFAPMGASLTFDSKGIRQFTVGTGGGRIYPIELVAPLSETRIMEWGVLKLVLSTRGYSWEFIPAAGSRSSDSGQDACD